MMSFDVLVRGIDGLEQADLARWISNSWVKPDLEDGCYVFEDIDIARVHLIYELREDINVNEAALPVVLSLLDQLYDLRRYVHAVVDAIAETAPNGTHQALRLVKAPSSGPSL